VKKCEDKTKFFKCRDGLGCIAKILTCDDQGDCKDNSDESEELCTEMNHTHRECDKFNEFECSPGICIPMKDKCDGIKNCNNGKDEDKEMCKYSNV
jgi:Low-density lipoprotein receptor domain class A